MKTKLFTLALVAFIGWAILNQANGSMGLFDQVVNFFFHLAGG